MNDILKEIADNSASYTKNDLVIADFISKNPDTCAIMTIQELAKELDVSESSIVRFSKKQGFHGYQNLKKVLQNRLQNALSVSSRIREACQGDDSQRSYQASFIELQTGYIRQLQDVVDTDMFRYFAEKIAGCRTLFLYDDGGASSSPGNTLQFWFERFGVSVTRIIPSGHRLFDKIYHNSPEDILVAFCFTKDNPSLTNLLEYCRSVGVETLLISDYSNGRTVSSADHVLLLERGPLELFHSMSIPVLFSESLVLSVAKLKGEGTLHSLKELEDLRQKYNV